MLRNEVDAHVHYRHSQAEVEALAKAIVPLHDALIAVSSSHERHVMRRIFGCTYFRRHEAARTRAMLLRVVKYARSHLDDYFPLMRQMILDNAQQLEDALTAYWVNFTTDARETIPTH